MYTIKCTQISGGLEFRGRESWVSNLDSSVRIEQIFTSPFADRAYQFADRSLAERIAHRARQLWPDFNVEVQDDRT